jgi:hypothetical protein
MFHIIIGLIGDSTGTLMQALAAAEIKFQKRPPEVVVIMECDEAIQISKTAVSATAAVAHAWLNERNSRKALLTLQNNTIERLEGRTAEDIQQLFRSAKYVVMIETQKPGSDKESIYLNLYKISLQNIRQLMDTRIGALDACANQLKGGDPKENKSIEELRSASIQQLAKLRQEIDTLLN